jgi:hypothetical protein
MPSTTYISQPEFDTTFMYVFHPLMNPQIYIGFRSAIYVLTPPKQSTESINCSLWMKLTTSLATRFDVTA